MSTFLFKNPVDGSIHEWYGSYREVPKQISVDGIVFKRDEVAEMKGQHAKPEDLWPLESNALGVHRSDVPAYEKFARDNGVPTKFTPDGKVIFRNKGHRKAYAELVGATDFDGGYGDPVSEGKKYD